MIDSKEAKDLALKSAKKNAEFYFNCIDSVIVRAAKEGKNSVCLNVSKLNNSLIREEALSMLQRQRFIVKEDRGDDINGPRDNFIISW